MGLLFGWASKGPLTAFYAPLARTLAHAQNSFKNLVGGLLVPLEVADSREVIAAGSSLGIHLRLCDLC